MESLKGFVITLCSTLIFISAVELIMPDNKIKKYQRFVLGLILISMIVTPINKMISDIKNVQEDSGINIMASKEQDGLDEDKENIEKSTLDKNQLLIENLERSIVSLLKGQYKDKDFDVTIDGKIDFDKLLVDISKITIGVKDEKRIKKVKKVEINKNKDTKDEEKKEIEKKDDAFTEEIKLLICKELKISSDKIVINYL